MNYRDKAATFKPNQKIADMGAKQIGPFEDIRSLKIACAGGGTTAQQQPGETRAPAAGGAAKSDTKSRSSGSSK